MSKINDLTESWNGHTHNEVETFLKEKLSEGGGGIQIVKFLISGVNELTLIDTYTPEEILYMALNGPIYGVIYYSPSSFYCSCGILRLDSPGAIDLVFPIANPSSQSLRCGTYHIISSSCCSCC